jgi:hypothetical protein
MARRLRRCFAPQIFADFFYLMVKFDEEALTFINRD